MMVFIAPSFRRTMFNILRTAFVLSNQTGSSSAIFTDRLKAHPLYWRSDSELAGGGYVTRGNTGNSNDTTPGRMRATVQYFR